MSGVADIWVPLLAAALGLVPYVLERRHRRRLEDDQRRRVWADISRIRGLMSDIERDSTPGPGALQAAGKLSDALRGLIHEACRLERRLDVATVRKWRATGRLASDWQEQLAMQMLHAEEVPQGDVDRLMKAHGNTDELPAEHPMSARRDNEP
ncbi:hypothetical protein [Candidatus Poriferisodalis sp.]|uniref:hypothetical protein n=1 Tax=Candidatus Poriferisodalis sp. TaxID=3101277 RepID=UPI003B012DAF